MDDIFALI